MKKIKVKFLRDYSYKVPNGKETKEKVVKKGSEMELFEPIVLRLTANPQDVVVERL